MIVLSCVCKSEVQERWEQGGISWLGKSVVSQGIRDRKKEKVVWALRILQCLKIRDIRNQQRKQRRRGQSRKRTKINQGVGDQATEVFSGTEQLLLTGGARGLFCWLFYSLLGILSHIKTHKHKTCVWLCDHRKGHLNSMLVISLLLYGNRIIYFILPTKIWPYKW